MSEECERGFVYPAAHFSVELASVSHPGHALLKPRTSALD